MLELLSLPATTGSLILQDLSVYTGIPSSPRLRLQSPARSTVYELPFTTGINNVYTLTQLGSLPDGIYLARYGVIPYTATEICYSFLRTENLQCRLDTWIRSVDWTTEGVNSKAYQSLTRISALILAAQAEARKGSAKASTYYSLASSLLAS